MQCNICIVLNALKNESKCNRVKIGGKSVPIAWKRYKVQTLMSDDLKLIRLIRLIFSPSNKVLMVNKMIQQRRDKFEAASCKLQETMNLK